MGLLDDPVGTITSGAEAAGDAASDAGGAVVDAAQDTGQQIVDAATDAGQQVVDAGGQAADDAGQAAAPYIQVATPLVTAGAAELDHEVDVLTPTASADLHVDLSGSGPKVTADAGFTVLGNSAEGSVDYGRGTVQVDGDASTSLLGPDTATVEVAAGTEQVGVQVTDSQPGMHVDAGPLHVTLDPTTVTAGGIVDTPKIDGPDLPDAPDSVTVGLPGGQVDAGPVHVTLDPVQTTIPVGDAVPTIDGPDVQVDAGAEVGPDGGSAHVVVEGDDVPTVRPVVDVDGEVDGRPGDGAIGVDVDLGVEVDGREVGVHDDGRIVDDGEGNSTVQVDAGVYTEADGQRDEIGVSADRTTSGDETQVDVGGYVDDGTRSEVGITQTHTGDWDSNTGDPTRNDEGIFVEHGDDRVEVGVTKSENEDWAHDTERGVYVEVDGERTEVGHSEVETASPFESATGGTGVYVEQGDERWDAGRAWEVGKAQDGSQGARFEVDPGPVTVHGGGTVDADGNYHDNNGIDIDNPEVLDAVADGAHATASAVEDAADDASGAMLPGSDEGWGVVIDGIDDGPGALADAAASPDGASATDFPDEFPELPDDLDVPVAVHDPLGDVMSTANATVDDAIQAIDHGMTDQPVDDSDDWSTAQIDDGVDDGSDDEEEDDGTNGDQGFLNSMGDAIGGAFGAVGDALGGLFG